MQKRTRYEILFFGCLLLWSAAKAAESQQFKPETANHKVQARVWTIRGQVEVLDPGNEMMLWRQAQLKDQVCEGTIIATGPGPSFTELVLPDHSLLKIAANSIVQLRALEHKVYLKKGNIVFNQPKRTLATTHYDLYTAAEHVVPKGKVQLAAESNDNRACVSSKRHVL